MQRRSRSSSGFGKTRHGAWIPGRLHKEEGPARGCLEDPGAVRATAHRSSSNPDKFGQCAWQLGELGRQKDLHERALTIKEQLYRKEHHLVAMTLKGLGIAHAQLGNFSQVKDLFERTLRIEEQHYGQEHPEVAATLTNLGIAHRKLVN